MGSAPGKYKTSEFSISRLNIELLRAAKTGNLQMIKDCLRIGANINVQNEWGGTPLYLACQYQHIDSVQQLILSGAKLRIKTSSGRTPFDIAILTENERLLQILEKYEAHKDAEPPPKLLRRLLEKFVIYAYSNL